MTIINFNRSYESYSTLGIFFVFVFLALAGLVAYKLPYPILSIPIERLIAIGIGAGVLLMAGFFAKTVRERLMLVLSISSILLIEVATL